MPSHARPSIICLGPQGILITRTRSDRRHALSCLFFAGTDDAPPDTRQSGALLLQEAHLLHSFGEDFYGKSLRIVVVAYLRPECDFVSLGRRRRRSVRCCPSSCRADRRCRFTPSCRGADRRDQNRHRCDRPVARAARIPSSPAGCFPFRVRLMGDHGKSAAASRAVLGRDSRCAVSTYRSCR